MPVFKEASVGEGFVEPHPLLAAVLLLYGAAVWPRYDAAAGILIINREENKCAG